MHLTPDFDFLLTLWPGDWRKQLATLNSEILKMSEKRKTSKKKLKQQKL